MAHSEISSAEASEIPCRNCLAIHRPYGAPIICTPKNFICLLSAKIWQSHPSHLPCPSQSRIWNWTYLIFNPPPASFNCSSVYLLLLLWPGKLTPGINCNLYGLLSCNTIGNGKLPFFSLGPTWPLTTSPNSINSTHWFVNSFDRYIVSFFQFLTGSI